MYETSKNWERFFYLCTWLFQGSSYLVPRAYGVMHRMHHAYSDTEKDPHSPHFFKDMYDMLKNTIIIYRSFLLNKNIPSEEFTKDIYINVIDMSGRTIISNRKINSGNKLNLGSSMKGNYIIQVKDKAGRLLTTEKLIKN
jgi:fatty-acid desaturase